MPLEDAALARPGVQDPTEPAVPLSGAQWLELQARVHAHARFAPAAVAVLADLARLLACDRVSRESKGRGGKTVTLVRGLALAPDALAALGKRLRSACGSGGTLKDGVLEVQGDHAERVVNLLQQDGFVVKRAGG